MIAGFLQKWEEGFKLVLGVKNKSKENPLMFLVRKLFYNILAKISDTDQVKNFTGFGLYNKQFIDVLRDLDDPYPYTLQGERVRRDCFGGCGHTPDVDGPVLRVVGRTAFPDFRGYGRHGIFTARGHRGLSGLGE